MFEQLGLDFVLKIIDDNFGDVLKDAKSQVDSFTKNADSSLSKLGNSLSGFGNKMTLGVTAPILAAGGAILKVASDFDEFESKYKASSGKTEKEVANHVKNVKEIYTEGVGETLEEVSDVVSNIETQLGSISGLRGSGLENISKQMIQFAKVTDSDVNESIRGLKAIMISFGVDAQTAMDYLVKGTQNGLNYTDELGDNLAEYAPLFKQNGYAVDEMFNILQAGVDSGSYNLDRMNDLIKEFGLRISGGDVKGAVEELGGSWKTIYDEWEKSGGSQYELMQALAKQLRNVSNETERSAIISAIWGTQGEDNGAKVIEALAGVSDAYGNVSGSGEQMYEDSLTFAQQLQAIWRELSVALEPLGKELLNILKENMPYIKETISAFTDFLSALSPEQIKMILQLAGLLALIGPIASVLGSIVSLISTFGSLFGMISSLGTVITGMFAGIGAMISGLMGAVVAFVASFGWIILAVVAVAVAIAGLGYLIYKNFDAISEFIGNVWDVIKKGAEVVFNIVKTIFTVMFNYIKNMVKGFVDTFIIGFNLIKASLTLTFSFIQSIIKGFAVAVNAMFKAVSAILKGVANLVSIIFNTALTIGINLIQGLTNGIIKGVSELLKVITNVANTILNTFKKIFNIHSPSRVMRDEIGKYLMEGIGEGLSKYENEALNPIDSLKNKMLGGFDDINSLSGSLDSDITSSQALTTVFDYEEEPAYIYLNMGRDTYKTFVRNISNAQDEEVDLEVTYGGI